VLQCVTDGKYHFEMKIIIKKRQMQRTTDTLKKLSTRKIHEILYIENFRNESKRIFVWK